MRQHRCPVRKNSLCLRTSRAPRVFFYQRGKDAHILGSHQWLKINRSKVAALLVEVAALVIHVCDAAAHACCKISAAWAKHNHHALVMYSQPWSPTPSTTAVAPELRTAKRSPAMPLKYASPLVAP